MPVPYGLGRRLADCYLMTGVVPQRQVRGGNSEQVSETSTYDMALSVSLGLGAQVPISGADREGGGVGGRRDLSDLWVHGMRSGGVERAKRPRAPDRDGSAQGGGIGSDGSDERADGHQAVLTVSGVTA